MSSTRPVNVGIIGAGLMGRESAMAIARWPALLDHPARPRVTAVCDVNPAALTWFDQVESASTKVTDYRDVLADDKIDVVYVAVRHDLHEQIYLDAIAAGKDLLAEKPFGIDLPAAQRIVAAAAANPNVFVRCSSEFPFYPGAQLALKILREDGVGDVIEVHSAFSHSSDFDPTKPMNWKRQRQYCGEPGVMNDLGMHVLHVPLRLGWMPDSVFAVLQNLVPERPGPSGRLIPCDTYENATLLCRVPIGREGFPMTLGMKRIDPGQKNTWLFRVLGMGGGVAYSTRRPKTVQVMNVWHGEQAWLEIEAGSQSGFETVTGSIFESGFSDAILQMWAAFLAEREGALGDRFGCVTPEEALLTHQVSGAALRSVAVRAAVNPETQGLTFA